MVGVSESSLFPESRNHMKDWSHASTPMLGSLQASACVCCQPLPGLFTGQAASQQQVPGKVVSHHLFFFFVAEAFWLEFKANWNKSNHQRVTDVKPEVPGKMSRLRKRSLVMQTQKIPCLREEPPGYGGDGSRKDFILGEGGITRWQFTLTESYRKGAMCKPQKHRPHVPSHCLLLSFSSPQPHFSRNSEFHACTFIVWERSLLLSPWKTQNFHGF